MASTRHSSSSSLAGVSWDSRNTLTGFVIGCIAATVTTTVTFGCMYYYYNNKLSINQHQQHGTDSYKDNITTRQKGAIDRSNSTNNSNNVMRNNINKNKKIPPEIRKEQLSRHQLYFGDDGMEALQHAKICIVGLGGVGSHTAHMLARSGIGMIRMIDFDQVTVSSLNRHAIASLSDVGIPKVTCLANYIRQHICPDETYLRIESFVEMYTEESGERLLNLNTIPMSSDDSTTAMNNTSLDPPCYDWTMVIDCIDDIPTKAALLKHCLQYNIRVVSCMGAGGKADFTRLHWSDLRTASKDPLATKLRQTLKQILVTNNKTDSSDDAGSRIINGRTYNDYLDDMDRLSVLYSSEKTVVKLADFTEEQKQESTGSSSSNGGYYQYGTMDGMRIRVVPVLGTMPAIFGQALATICLTITANKTIQPVTGERIGRNVRNRIYQHLKSYEQKITKHTLQCINMTEIPTDQLDRTGGYNIQGVYINNNIQIDQDDVEYLMELWRNRCAITGDRLGCVLELVRWDISKPTMCSNLILVSSTVVSKYFNIDEILKGNTNMYGIANQSIDPSIRQVIERRLESCKI